MAYNFKREQIPVLYRCFITICNICPQQKNQDIWYFLTDIYHVSKKYAMVANQLWFCVNDLSFYSASTRRLFLGAC